MAKAHKRNEVLKNLALTRGQVYKACQLTGIAPVSFYRWIDKYPDFADKVEEVKAGTYEYVEDKLFENIEKGNVGAQVSYLKAKHPEYKPAGSSLTLIDNKKVTNVKLSLSNEQIDTFIKKRYGINTKGKYIEAESSA